MQSVRRRCRCTQTAFALHAIRELHNLYTLQKLALTSYIPVCNNIFFTFYCIFLQYTKCNAMQCMQSESCTIYTAQVIISQQKLTFPFAIISIYILLHFLQNTQTAFALHAIRKLHNLYSTSYPLSAKTYIPVCNDIYLHFIAFFCSTPNVMQCNARTLRAAQFIQRNLQKIALS